MEPAPPAFSFDPCWSKDGHRVMPNVVEEWKKELRTLVNQMRIYPSRDWTAARQRVVILTQMLANRTRNAGA